MMRALFYALALGSACADLRMASQPKNGWVVRDRSRKYPFVPDFSSYMEPSDFGYEGLKKQRDGGGYDNFLRSNIDNEQDRRNFKTEVGRDHLPFRSYETAVTDAHYSVKHKLPASLNTVVGRCPQAGGTWENRRGQKRHGDVCRNPGKRWDCPIGCEYTSNKRSPYCYLTGTKDVCHLGSAGGVITATPGEPVTVPLRWNNPHSSELEVNVWIQSQGWCNGGPCNGLKPRYVVPVRKPTCSGEGHRDNVFVFTIPSDFNSLGNRIPGFTGCKKKGDCVLQIYAHSVESRMYAMGTPLIVTGTVPAATASTTAGIAEPSVDVGLTLKGLTRKTCLSSADPSANIASAMPRKPRLISDQFNHAFQNSDFSPYSGQQPESISRNLQASCILKMVTGNRGELGKFKMARDNRTVFNFQRRIERRAKSLVRVYESITNQIISAIGKDMENTDASMPTASNSTQRVATCFRCAEVGAVTTRRLTTNTYVPSFLIPKALVATAKLYIAPIYLQSGFLEENVNVNGDARLLIYEAVLHDMNTQFAAAGHMGLGYMGPALKTEFSTKPHVTDYLKKDASGKYDRGYYAATEAGLCWPYVSRKASPCASKPIAQEFVQHDGRRRLSAANSIRSLIDASIDDDDAALITAEGSDMNGVGRDSACDDDANADLNATIEMDSAKYVCHIPGDTAPAAWQLFADAGQMWPASNAVRLPHIDFDKCCGTASKKAEFLESCSAANAPLTCTDVKAGSAVVTFAGSSEEVAALNPSGVKQFSSGGQDWNVADGALAEPANTGQTCAAAISGNSAFCTAPLVPKVSSLSQPCPASTCTPSDCCTKEDSDGPPFVGGFFFGFFVGAALAAAAVGLVHFVGASAVWKRVVESPQPAWAKAGGAFLLVGIVVMLLALGSTQTSLAGFWTGILAGIVLVFWICLLAETVLACMGALDKEDSLPSKSDPNHVLHPPTSSPSNPVCTPGVEVQVE